MKKLVLILAMVTCFTGFSQSVQNNQLKVLQDYKSAFNNSNYKAIYDFFSNTYKQNMTFGNFQMRADRLKQSYGNIQSVEASEKSKEGFKVFDALFTKPKDKRFALMVKFNNQNKIDYISFNKNK